MSTRAVSFFYDVMNLVSRVSVYCSFAKSSTVVSPLSHFLVTLYLVIRQGLCPWLSSSASRSSSASSRPCSR